MFEKTREALNALDDIADDTGVPTARTRSAREELSEAEAELAARGVLLSVEWATSKTMAEQVEREAAKADAERAVGRQLRADMEACQRELAAYKAEIVAAVRDIGQARQRAIRAEDTASKLQAELDAKRAARKVAATQEAQLFEKARADLAIMVAETNSTKAELARARESASLNRIGLDEARKRIRTLEAARDKAERDRNELQALAKDAAGQWGDDLAAERAANRKLRAMLAEAQEAVALVKTDVEGVWRYQGDGEDHPESLSCPVIMSAERLRSLLHDASDARLLAEEERRRVARDEIIEDERLSARLKALESQCATLKRRLCQVDEETVARLMNLEQKDGVAVCACAHGDRLSLLEQAVEDRKVRIKDLDDRLSRWDTGVTAGLPAMQREIASIDARLKAFESLSPDELAHLAWRDALVKELDERLTIWVQSTQREIHGLHTRLQPFEICPSLGRHVWDDAGICAKCGVSRANCP